MVYPIPSPAWNQKKAKKEKGKRHENAYLTTHAKPLFHFSFFFFPYVCPSFILGILPRRGFVLASPSPLSHRPRVVFRVDPTFMDLDTNIILYGIAVRGGGVSLVIRKAGPCMVTGSTMVVRSDPPKRKRKKKKKKKKQGMIILCHKSLTSPESTQFISHLVLHVYSLICPVSCIFHTFCWPPC